MTGPIHTLKLVLNVEQPNPNGTRNEDNRKLNQDVGLKADRQARRPNNANNRQVIENRPVALALSGILDRKAMEDEK